MSRKENVLIFRDTEEICKSNEKLVRAIAESNSKQYIVKEEDSITLTDVHRFENSAKVIVSKKRSLEAASYYKNKNICVHNFASASNPGGGVVHGSSAQEEAICRCSTLYFTISRDEVYKEFHGRHRNMLKNGEMNSTYNDDCIYTPNVVVFKSDDESPKLLHEEEWYSVNVITCAAPNLRERPSNEMNPDSGSTSIKLSDLELRSLHEKRVRRILDICKKEKADVVILGAFGCGAFKNNPKVVAEAMNNVIKEYQYDFETIEFAIYCPPDNSNNYDAFNQIIER